MQDFFAIAVLRKRNVSVKEYSALEEHLKKKRRVKERHLTSHLKYNTGLRRFIALIIDGFAIGFISQLINYMGDSESKLFIQLMVYIGLILPYIYSIILHGCCGQTFGKIIMGIKLFDKDEVSNVTFLQASLRDAVPITLIMISQIIPLFIDLDNHNHLFAISITMGIFVFFWSLMEIITMVFHPKKRALHDFIAKTIVLRIT